MPFCLCIFYLFFLKKDKVIIFLLALLENRKRNRMILTLDLVFLKKKKEFCLENMFPPRAEDY